MKLIVDRFEQGYAVCEDENNSYINIDIEKLPSNVKEGDIIIYDNGIITIDIDATSERKKYIEELTSDIWN